VLLCAENVNKFFNGMAIYGQHFFFHIICSKSGKSEDTAPVYFAKKFNIRRKNPVPEARIFIFGTVLRK
jgi:hypothetical protein